MLLLGRNKVEGQIRPTGLVFATCVVQYVLGHFPPPIFYLFLGREKERERNINMWLSLEHPLLGTWPATQACTLTGNQISNPLVHGPALSPLSYTSQGCTGTLLRVQRDAGGNSQEQWA